MPRKQPPPPLPKLEHWMEHAEHGHGSKGATGQVSTLEATQGKILSQSPTDATRFWWHLFGS